MSRTFVLTILVFGVLVFSRLYFALPRIQRMRSYETKRVVGLRIDRERLLGFVWVPDQLTRAPEKWNVAIYPKNGGLTSCFVDFWPQGVIKILRISQLPLHVGMYREILKCL